MEAVNGALSRRGEIGSRQHAGEIWKSWKHWITGRELGSSRMSRPGEIGRAPGEIGSRSGDRTGAGEIGRDRFLGGELEAGRGFTEGF